MDTETEGQPMTDLNAFFWVGSNLLIAYIAIALVVFSLTYPILFDPGATTAGRLILRFAGSLIGVISLVAISIFVDPRVGSAWWEFPGDVLSWRPALRFAVYSYVAYGITSLVVLLWLRKYRPHRLQTAPDEITIPVKVRNPRRLR
jgi:hypothetical protein